MSTKVTLRHDRSRPNLGGKKARRPLPSAASVWPARQHKNFPPYPKIRREGLRKRKVTLRHDLSRPNLGGKKARRRLPLAASVWPARQHKNFPPYPKIRREGLRKRKVTLRHDLSRPNLGGKKARRPLPSAGSVWTALRQKCSTPPGFQTR